MTNHVKSNLPKGTYTMGLCFPLSSKLELLGLDDLIVEANNTRVSSSFSILFTVKDTPYAREVMGYSDNTKVINLVNVNDEPMLSFTVQNTFGYASAADIYRLHQSLLNVSTNLVFVDNPDMLTAKVCQVEFVSINKTIIHYNFKDGKYLSLLQARLNPYSIKYFDDLVMTALPEYKDALAVYSQRLAQLDYKSDYAKAKREEIVLKHKLLDSIVDNLARLGVPHALSRLNKKLNKNK